MGSTNLAEFAEVVLARGQWKMRGKSRGGSHSVRVLLKLKQKLVEYEATAELYTIIISMANKKGACIESHSCKNEHRRDRREGKYFCTYQDNLQHKWDCSYLQMLTGRRDYQCEPNSHQLSVKCYVCFCLLEACAISHHTSYLCLLVHM